MLVWLYDVHGVRVRQVMAPWPLPPAVSFEGKQYHWWPEMMGFKEMPVWHSAPQVQGA